MAEHQAMFITPEWGAPAAVRALCTTRFGGVSSGPWGEFNLAAHVEDEPTAVAKNRETLLKACDGLAQIQWLNQTHSPRCIVAEGDSTPDADAAVTDQSALACAVLTADCLPVLFCDETGSQVAAAHAGWRGLLDGVLVNTVKQFHGAPETLYVWLGPCIRQPRFEVGAEVREAFVGRFAGPSQTAIESCFITAGEPDKFLCDLAGLTALQLRALGLSRLSDSGLCTAEDPRFYSYRQHNPCGRFASLIYRLP